MGKYCFLELMDETHDNSEVQNWFTLNYLAVAKCVVLVQCPVGFCTSCDLF